MSKVILYMITTLDGFIADHTGVLDYAPSDEEHTFANELFDSVGTLLFGRVVYEGFSGYWDTLDLNDATVPAVERNFAQIFRAKRRLVFSRTLTTVQGNTEIVREAIPATVNALKQSTTEDLLLVCGPELLATFVQAGLVDELCLIICPLVLGSGIALFRELPDKLPLTGIATRRFASGSVLLRYQLRTPDQSKGD